MAISRPVDLEEMKEAMRGLTVRNRLTWDIGKVIDVTGKKDDYIYYEVDIGKEKAMSSPAHEWDLWVQGRAL